MRRIVCLASALVVAVGITGCGESGDATSGMPKNTGFVPLNDPNVSTDMTKVGNKPKPAPKPAASPAPAPEAK